MHNRLTLVIYPGLRNQSGKKSFNNKQRLDPKEDYRASYRDFLQDELQEDITRKIRRADADVSSIVLSSDLLKGSSFIGSNPIRKRYRKELLNILQERQLSSPSFHPLTLAPLEGMTPLTSWDFTSASSDLRLSMIAISPS
ncbi:hypothetical protein MRB53_036559 [Persea americana]|nr:hypothetical protein MRB53_037468 [Persea americana]KAJ8613915.1 hypothetical protein MRB53_036769 [Persea americana]KAJ8613965.1 hypothetical protein MRB53_036756 [Persea americana]KAJ8614693.1 hypothetical protein MRB53_036559 [Persea americana]